MNSVGLPIDSTTGVSSTIEEKVDGGAVTKSTQKLEERTIKGQF